MNEKVSIFIDKLSIEKIVNEKLGESIHIPKTPIDNQFSVEHNFRDFQNVKDATLFINCNSDDNQKLSFTSYMSTKYYENNEVYVDCHTVKNSIGNYIFVHGLFEDDLTKYNVLIKELNKNQINVFIIKLPYHFERKPLESKFSGEYFWSADIYRSAYAFKQGVYDLYQLYCYIKQSTQQPVFIMGFSMGGCISLILYSIFPELDGLFLINPVSHLTKISWEHSLFQSIKHVLLQYDFTFEKLFRIFQSLEPLIHPTQSYPKQNIVLARAIYDQFVEKEDYDNLEKKWALKHVIQYNAGHMNIFRVPKLSTDIVNFFKRSNSALFPN